MFFTRTHNFHFAVPKDELKKRLVGSHVRIHNLDFEILDKDGSLRIIPHAEQIDGIKTLPITHINFKEEGDKTKVTVTSKMRKFDSGGPQLIVIFCLFMIIIGIVLFFVNKGDRSISYMLLGIGGGIFAIFAYRMQTGYFDYVRKIRAYVKSKESASVEEVKEAVVAH